MPKIIEERPYNGALEKVDRLGLESLLAELRSLLAGFQLRVLEEKDSNGGGTLREILDARFAEAEGWTKTQTGGVDWAKCRITDGTSVCVGVEIQVSARSDLLIMDIVHLRGDITEGKIDVGFLVVPSDRLAAFLTDRAPAFSDALRHVEQARATDLPLIVVALEHDGPGPALPKRRKRSSKKT
jgi:hypothetical protein